MKGLKKVALASAIAAVSAGAQAELKALDDSAMGELTGQAGITIDVETAYRIGEFAYQDIEDATDATGGFVVIQDIELKANSNETSSHGSSTLVDNFRMTIDVANGDGQLYEYGLSEAGSLAGIASAAFSNTNPGIQAAAAGALTNGAGTNILDGNAIDAKKTYNDGDLIIHFGFTDAMQKGGGLQAMIDGSGTLRDEVTTTNLTDISWAQALDIGLHSTDYQLDIGVLGIASSAHDIGNTAVETAKSLLGAGGLATADSDTTNTALLSGISFKGYQGPDDLHIANAGNGFTATGKRGAVGSGNADSKITWGDFFKVTDLDVYIDIAGVNIEDMVIANTRGDVTSIDGTSSFGFAHSIRTIYAVNEDVIDYKSLAPAALGGGYSDGDGWVDGVAINTRFKGDIDINHLSFGNEGTSIGKIFITDIDSTSNMTISAH